MSIKDYIDNLNAQRRLCRLIQARIDKLLASAEPRGAPLICAPSSSKGKKSSFVEDRAILLSEAGEEYSKEYGTLLRMQADMFRKISEVESPKIRNILACRAVDGKTWDEISELLNQSPESLKRCYHRFLKADQIKNEKKEDCEHGK